MKRKILVQKNQNDKFKYTKLQINNRSTKLILQKLILIFFLFILYKNDFIKYLMKGKVKLILIENQSTILSEIISFENKINISLNEIKEFRDINSNNELIEKINFEKCSYPDVSIIMTMYNQAHCIHKGIRSVQNQSIKNIEIIIVDDCSQDNGTDIIKEFQKKDERIILISHDMNEGEIKSRTDGIRKAKGKYITIIDGDDALIHKNILKNCLFIAQKGNLDVVEFNDIDYDKGKFGNKFNNYNEKNLTEAIFIKIRIYLPMTKILFSG